MKEAIEKGIIPVAGKSVVGDRILTEDDILKAEDILQQIPYDFENNYGWYGVG
jgi:homospermidine synthase